MADLVIDPFSRNSWAAAAKAVREMRKKVEDRNQEFLERLADKGIVVARARFSDALASYDGDETPIDVSIGEKTTTTIEIIASGETVAFLEFGAGISYPSAASEYYSIPPYQHGTYGKGYGNRWTWYFYADPVMKTGLTKTHGNPPGMAMAGAMEEIAKVCADVAREVFGND